MVVVFAATTALQLPSRRAVLLSCIVLSCNEPVWKYVLRLCHPWCRLHFMHVCRVCVLIILKNPINQLSYSSGTEMVGGILWQ